MVFAQAAEALGSNSTLLGALLSGTLIGAVIAAYKFVVNFRTTERGMTRARIAQANQGERLAQREASLWQLRCGDLEYRMAQAGLPVPELSRELAKFVHDSEIAKADDTSDDPTGGRPAP